MPETSSALKRIGQRACAVEAGLGVVLALCVAVFMLVAAGSAAASVDSSGDIEASPVARAAESPARISVIDPVRAVGKPARIAGRVPLGTHDRVVIGFRPNGSQRWWRLTDTRANAKGRFLATVPAVRNGRLVAIPRIGTPSRPAEVRVLSRTRFAPSRRHVNLGEEVGLVGLADPGGRRGFRVAIKGPDGQIIDRTTNRAGEVRAGWRPQTAGRYVLRAFAGTNRHAYGSKGPRKVVDVYRPAGASWYGPSFYGGRSACGLLLTPSTTGVAHKTLPCGTPVRIRYGNRVVDTRVIDRGPYVAGREFDLIQSTRNALGFGDVGTIHVSH